MTRPRLEGPSWAILGPRRGTSSWPAWAGRRSGDAARSRRPWRPGTRGGSRTTGPRRGPLRKSLEEPPPRGDSRSPAGSRAALRWSHEVLGGGGLGPWFQKVYRYVLGFREPLGDKATPAPPGAPTSPRTPRRPGLTRSLAGAPGWVGGRSGQVWYRGARVAPTWPERPVATDHSTTSDKVSYVCAGRHTRGMVC